MVSRYPRRPCRSPKELLRFQGLLYCKNIGLLCLKGIRWGGSITSPRRCEKEKQFGTKRNGTFANHTPYGPRKTKVLVINFGKKIFGKLKCYSLLEFMVNRKFSISDSTKRIFISSFSNFVVITIKYFLFFKNKKHLNQTTLLIISKCSDPSEIGYKSVNFNFGVM